MELCLKKGLLAAFFMTLLIAGSYIPLGDASTRASKGAYSSDLTPHNGISNEKLVLDVNRDGRFTLKTMDGRWLTFPELTTYFTFLLDMNAYAPEFRNPLTGLVPSYDLYSSIDEYVVSDPVIVDAATVEARFQIKSVDICVRFVLSEEVLIVEVQGLNNDSMEHKFGIRLMLDTQLDENDGAPLYSEATGVKIKETLMEPVVTNVIKAYDIWPNPTLTSYLSLIDLPDRLYFAHWPEAVKYAWQYRDYDSNRKFFTPGYTRSPESDSCISLFWDPLTLRPDSIRRIKLAYGLSEIFGRKEVAFSLLESIKNNLLGFLDVGEANLRKILEIARNTHTADELFLIADALMFFISLEAPGVQWTNLEKAVRYGNAMPQIWRTVSHAFLHRLTTTSGSLSKILTGLEFINLEKDIWATIFSNTIVGGNGENIYNLRAKLEGKIHDTFQESHLILETSALPNDVLELIVYRLSLIDRQLAAIRSGDRIYMVLPIPQPSGLMVYDKLGTLAVERISAEKLYEDYLAKKAISTILSVISVGTFYAGTHLLATGVGWEAALFVFAISAVAGLAGAKISDWAAEGKAAIGTIASEAPLSFAQDLLITVEVVAASVREDIRSITHNPDLEAYRRNGKIAKLDPPLIVGPYEIKTGKASVTNEGREAGASLITHLYSAGGLTALKDVLPPINFSLARQESKEIEMFFRGIDSSLWGSPYLAKTELWLGFNLAGYASTTFKVGLLGVIDRVQENVRALISDTLRSGERRSVTISTPLDVGKLVIRLVFLGSDLDLHLYDSMGRHIGRNYATGEVDMQIPYVQYSGPTGNPEFMTVIRPEGEYRIEVIALSALQPEPFEVSVVETPTVGGILTVYPSKIDLAVALFPDMKWLNTSLTLAEAEGQRRVTGISISGTNLAGEASNLIFQGVSTQPTLDLEAGSSLPVEIRYRIPADARDGKYSGVITLTSSSGTITIPVQVNVTKAGTGTSGPVILADQSGFTRSAFIAIGTFMTMLVVGIMIYAFRFRVVPICPSCGARVSSRRARYCRRCGSRLRYRHRKITR